MAIINSLAIGKAKNSAGNLTYSTIEGRTIGRAKPVSVRNPNTPAQQSQRDRLKTLVHAWRENGIALKRLWTVRKPYSSAYNEFVSQNMPVADAIKTWLFGPVKAKPAGLMLGKGKYPHTSFEVEEFAETEAYVSCVNQTLWNDAQAGDKVGYVQFDPVTFQMSVQELTLDEMQVTAPMENVVLEFSNCKPGIGVMDCVYFYSPSRNISSSVVIHTQ